MAPSNKITIQFLKQEAKKQNIDILQDKYEKFRKRFNIFCNNCCTHSKSTADRILSGSGCTTCNKIQRYLKILDSYIKIAEENNLTIITTEKDLKHIFDYIRNEIFVVKCKICSSIFTKKQNMLDNGFRGFSCENCYQQHMFQECHRYAAENDGYFLSDEFINTKYKYKWMCHKGDIWEDYHSCIKRRAWCPYCAERVHNLEDVQKTARSRGGKCLSDKYTSWCRVLLFECQEGHIFELTPHLLLTTTSWCPECAKCDDHCVSIGEKITKCNFEQLFGEQFIKIRPNWLVNDRGNKMELDGYSSILKMAFEFNGGQHKNIVKKFNMTEESLKRRKEDDLLKIKLCNENGIKLIVIDDDEVESNFSNIKQIIKQKCLQLNVDLPYNYDHIVVDLIPAFANCKKQILNELKEIAKSKEGELLSDVYISFSGDLYCKCKFGHIFLTCAGNLRQDYWCPECSPTKRNELSKIQEFAKSIGLICLSEEYVNQHELLKFMCEHGHIFERSYKQLKRFPYCRVCKSLEPKKTKYVIEDMKNHAIKKDGLCLSDKYISFFEKLLWYCNKHKYQWEASAASVIHGDRWCMLCGRERSRLATINRFKKNS